MHHANLSLCVCVSYNATGEELLSVQRSTGPFVLIWLGLAGVKFWCLEDGVRCHHNQL